MGYPPGVAHGQSSARSYDGKHNRRGKNNEIWNGSRFDMYEILQLVIATCLLGSLFSPCVAKVPDSLKCSVLNLDAKDPGIFDRSCWKELARTPKCYVWGRYHSFTVHDSTAMKSQTLSWTGECAGELAQGNGTLTLVDIFGREVHSMEATGLLKDGKRTGRWNAVWTNDEQTEVGTYVNGERHGKFVTHWRGDGRWQGGRNEVMFVNGVKHGYWFIRFDNGLIRECNYVNGKMHGRWTERKPDGAETTKMYEYGKEVLRIRSSQDGCAVPVTLKTRECR